MRRVIVSLLAATIALVTLAPAQQPPGFQIELQPVLSNLTSPVYVTHARDSTGRLFIVEQPGRVLVLQPGAATPALFLDITAKVLSGGERGLLGLAFHPEYSSNGRFFVNYTRRGDGATVIAEYRVSPTDQNRAGTEEHPLLSVGQPFSNHNGGMIEFGPDGYLYIAMGDGGSANDPGNRAQNPEDLLGKILRIDVDNPSGNQPYSSPSDNPFFGTTPGRDEVYAVGMRNPWRFSFDRATGQLYAGDVGQGSWEEIDVITRGGNYGWRVMEGNHCNPNFPGQCIPPAGHIAPIAEYSSATGARCSVTGGYVYRGALASLPLGSYVFGDFCTGEIFLYRDGQVSLLVDTSLNISSFGEDEAGEIYAVSLSGSVHRIANPSAPAPGSLRIDSVIVRRRSTKEPLEPVTTKSNGKKYEVLIRGEGFAPGAVVMVNGVAMSTKEPGASGAEIRARLKRATLRNPGALTVELANPDGGVSNRVIIDVFDEQ
jgi:glucose/arabinose dehydrogenase